MKIYLPLKDDLLDHGDANSTWKNPYTSTLIPKAGTIIDNVKCAKFSNGTTLAITNTALISSLTIWTLQCWFYPYTNTNTNSLPIDFMSNQPIQNSSKESICIYASLLNGLLNVCGTTITSSVEINTWHSLYITCDGTTIYIYYDNQPRKSISRRSRGFTLQLHIGKSNDTYNNNEAFRGGITQFCLSDKYNDERLGLLSQVIYLSENKEVYGMV